MMSLIMKFHDEMKDAVEKGISLQRALELPVKDEIARAKIHPSETFDGLARELDMKINQQFDALSTESLGIAR